MTPEEFKVKAQELYDEHKGYAGEDGHMKYYTVRGTVYFYCEK